MRGARTVMIGFARLSAVFSTMLQLCSAQQAPQDFCVGSRSVVVAAQNGGNRAYAETVAKRPKPKAGTGVVAVACTDRAKLFVSVVNEDFQLAYMQAPTQSWPGAEMKLVDWSPTGEYLLVDLFTFQFEGEGAGHSPLIYDADSGLYTPDLFKLFKAHFKKACDAPSSIEGFTSDGLILLKVGPLIRDTTFEPLTYPSCVKEKGYWAVDFKKDEIKFIANHYEAKKYSH